MDVLLFPKGAKVSISPELFPDFPTFTPKQVAGVQMVALLCKVFCPDRPLPGTGTLADAAAAIFGITFPHHKRGELLEAAGFCFPLPEGFSLPDLPYDARIAGGRVFWCDRVLPRIQGSTPLLERVNARGSRYNFREHLEYPRLSAAFEVAATVCALTRGPEVPAGRGAIAEAARALLGVEFDNNDRLAIARSVRIAAKGAPGLAVERPESDPAIEQCRAQWARHLLRHLPSLFREVEYLKNNGGRFRG